MDNMYKVMAFWTGIFCRYVLPWRYERGIAIILR